MDRDERNALIARYEAGPAEVEAALEEVGPAALDRQTGPGEWTVREVVHHLADSEMTSAIRLRRLIAEDAPRIPGYDEPGYARIFRYAERPIEPALAALRAARATTAQILTGLTDDDWQRAGIHEESGPYSVVDWLRIYATHAHDHADQIRRAGEG